MEVEVVELEECLQEQLHLPLQLYIQLQLAVVELVFLQIEVMLVQIHHLQD
jgi:hypothetical protein